MGHYKIQNITNTLPKRHAKLNSTHAIKIDDSFKSQTITILPNEEFLLETNFLPMKLHKLRAEGLISIIEMDKDSYHKLVNESKKKSTPQLTENKPVVQSVAETVVEEVKPKKHPVKTFRKEEQD